MPTKLEKVERSDFEDVLVGGEVVCLYIFEFRAVGDGGPCGVPAKWSKHTGTKRGCIQRGREVRARKAAFSLTGSALPYITLNPLRV